MPFFNVPSPINIKYPKPKWINNEALVIFMAALPSNFRFCNFPHKFHSKLEGTASSWYMIWRFILVRWFRNWKNTFCITKRFCKLVSWLCHKHAVTMLTQPGHVWGAVGAAKELKSSLFVQAHDKSQISSCSSFSELKTMMCFESGLKSLKTNIWAHCSEWNSTNHGSKCTICYN